MALYNTSFELLENTIKSILSQSFDDFELLIIDDASKYNYKSFLKDFKDNRIKYFKLENNSGPGYARNFGIRQAQGDYVAIVDSDDVYMQDRFKMQSEFLDSNPDIAIISGAFKNSNNGKIVTLTQNDDEIKVDMLFNSPFANPLIMFKREVFAEKILYYPEKMNFAEDYSLWIDAMFRMLKMANLNEILMVYTRHSGQLSRLKKIEQMLIMKNIYKKIFTKFGIEFNDEEIDLHYNISFEKYGGKDFYKKTQNWLSKIVEHNKISQIFNQEVLTHRMQMLELKVYDSTKRLFKIKLGDKNLVLIKPLKIILEQR